MPMNISWFMFVEYTRMFAQEKQCSEFALLAQSRERILLSHSVAPPIRNSANSLADKSFTLKALFC